MGRARASLRLIVAVCLVAATLPAAASASHTPFAQPLRVPPVLKPPAQDPERIAQCMRSGTAAAPGTTIQKSKRSSLGLPSTRTCKNRRRLAFRLRAPDGRAPRSARIYLNGRRVRTLSGKRTRALIVLRNLPRRRARLRVVMRTSRGKLVTATRTYRTCGSIARQSAPAPARAAAEPAMSREACTGALRDQPIDLPMREADVPILPGEATRMWTYGGTFPGPTIETDTGAPVRVKVTNDLPASAGAMSLHRHGGHQPEHEDGQPDQDLVPPGGTKTYDYPLTEDGRPERAAFEWYHDHRMDVTRRNVWNGLAGMIVTHDAAERALNLPSGDRDVPLMIADRTFAADNQLTDPFVEASKNPLTNQTPQTGRPPGDETVGDHLLVNGTPQPFFQVEPRRYRLRVLNATLFQPYNLHLSTDQSMLQVGTESGLLPEVLDRKQILLGTAERADIVVDFSGQAGKTVTLESVDRADGKTGTGTSPYTGGIMQFRVAAGAVPDTSAVPKTLRSLPEWTKQASRTPARTFAFGLTNDAQKGPLWAINGEPFDPNKMIADPKVGTTETWRFTNTSQLAHFIHVHQGDGFAVARNGGPVAVGEAGLKDTWRIDPGDSVDVAFHFSDFAGKFVFHCHMLDHEDHGMMANFRVVGPGAGAAAAAGNDNSVFDPGVGLPAHAVALTGAMHGHTGGDAHAHGGAVPLLLAVPAWAVSILTLMLAFALVRIGPHAPRRVLGVALLGGVGITHAGHLGATFAAAPYVGVLFGAVILAAGGLAVALAVGRHEREAWAGAAALGAATSLAYVVSRTAGLPHLEDHVGLWLEPEAIAAIACEVGIMAAAAWPTLRGHQVPRLPARRVRLALATATVLSLMIATSAVRPVGEALSTWTA